MVKPRLQFLALVIVFTAIMGDKAHATSCQLALSDIVTKISHIKPQIAEVSKAAAHYQKVQDEAIEELPIESGFFNTFYSEIESNTKKLASAKALHKLEEAAYYENTINSLLASLAMSIDTSKINSKNSSVSLHAHFKTIFSKKGSIEKSEILTAFMAEGYLPAELESKVYNKAIRFSESFDIIHSSLKIVIHLDEKIKTLQEESKSLTLKSRIDSNAKSIVNSLNLMLIHLELATNLYYGDVARSFSHINPEFRP